MSEQSVDVFAYGSNLSVPRLLARVSNVQVLGIGYVLGRRFAYHKRSVDGSAKADAAHTGSDDDRVWGAIYRMGHDDKMILDHYESLGVGYDHQQVSVITQQGTRSAWLYFARSDFLTARLKPYQWYHRLVIDGALWHRLPCCYVQEIAATEAIQDRDQQRAEKHRRLVNKRSFIVPERF